MMFFSMMLADAYIGNLLVYLSTLLCMKYTQLTASIINHLLELAGEKLLLKYRRNFVDQLKIIKNEFIPGF